MATRQQHSELHDGIGTYLLKNGDRRYRVVMKVNGKTVSKGGFVSKEAARKWRDVERADVHRGEWIAPRKGRRRFGDYADEWMTVSDLRPSTRANYRQLLKHQLACWRDVSLDRITPEDVRRWVARLRNTPGPRTGRPPAEASVRKAYRLLQTIMKQAAQDGCIKHSPCTVKFKKAPTPDLYCPTLPEVQRLADEVPIKYRALVLLAGRGGLRWGECIALTRRHVDLANDCVHVRQVVVETGEHEVYLQATPKTEAGRRTVYLDDGTAQAIREQLRLWADPGTDGLLFPAKSSAGESPYMRRSNFHSRVWRPAVKACGLPRVRFHDLRHAAATIAAQGGYTTAELMAHIGHADARAAMRYQHAADDRMRLLSKSVDIRLAAASG